LRQQSAELQRRGIDVAVVTFEELWRAEAYAEETQLLWPLLIDRQRQLFTAYGMERGTPQQVMGWTNWMSYIRLLLRGRRLRLPTNDVYQLGGDVLIDPQGIVRLHHISRGPADRPALSALLAAAN
jgi:hypothetical protein